MGSHDFIRFPPALAQLSARTWLLLGEIQATAQTVRVSPILPAHSYELEKEYLAKGIHGSTAIMGNSFSEDEVAKLIDGELPAYASRIAELRQIKNIAEAFNMVARDEMFGGPSLFSLEKLNRYHELVMNGLGESNGEQIQVGALRKHGAKVGPYLAPPPEAIEPLIKQYCDWLNADEEASHGLDGYDIARAIIKSLVAHVSFVWIRPYGDGNGRMARLIEHAILLRAGLPEACTHVLSYFYSKTRRQYYAELQRSHGEYDQGAYPPVGDLRRFIEYALEGFMDELGDLMLVIGSMQVQAIWRDHIRACFPSILTTKQQRQMRLALDLTDRCVDQPVILEVVREVSAAIELEYADESDAVLAGDLDALVKMDLLVHDDRGYQPNPALMLSLFGNSGLNQI